MRGHEPAARVDIAALVVGSAAILLAARRIALAPAQAFHLSGWLVLGVLMVAAANVPRLVRGTESGAIPPAGTRCLWWTSAIAGWGLMFHTVLGLPDSVFELVLFALSAVVVVVGLAAAGLARCGGWGPGRSRVFRTLVTIYAAGLMSLAGAALAHGIISHWHGYLSRFIVVAR